MRTVTMLFAATIISLPSATAFAQGVATCGNLAGAHFGPFDYRKAPKETKQMVEGAHFTPDVERLRKGSTSTIGADINYTLLAFPNHPRALLAMSKLAFSQKLAQPKGAAYSVGCYFDRAVRWAPDDPQVRLVYAIHLVQVGQKDQARAQLEIAERYAIDDANFHYNLGLAFLDVGDADRALTHAWRAYAQGYELSGLRNRLEKLGKWRDPEK